MRVGSIVICLPLVIHDHWKDKITWLPVMDEKEPYMLREIYPDPLNNTEMVVVFEEGIIGYNNEGQELTFPASHVRELLPPEDLVELIEELNYETIPG